MRARQEIKRKNKERKTKTKQKTRVTIPEIFRKTCPAMLAAKYEYSKPSSLFPPCRLGRREKSFGFVVVVQAVFNKTTLWCLWCFAYKPTAETDHLLLGFSGLQANFAQHQNLSTPGLWQHGPCSSFLCWNFSARATSISAREAPAWRPLWCLPFQFTQLKMRRLGRGKHYQGIVLGKSVASTEVSAPVKPTARARTHTLSVSLPVSLSLSVSISRARARSHSRTHSRTHARTHAQAHTRTHERTLAHTHTSFTKNVWIGESI